MRSVLVTVSVICMSHICCPNPLPSTLRRLLYTAYPPPSTLCPPPPIFYTLPSTLYSPASTLYRLPSTLYTPHSTLRPPPSTIYIPSAAECYSMCGPAIPAASLPSTPDLPPIRVRARRRARTRACDNCTVRHRARRRPRDRDGDCARAPLSDRAVVFVFCCPPPMGNSQVWHSDNLHHEIMTHHIAPARPCGSISTRPSIRADLAEGKSSWSSSLTNE